MPERWGKPVGAARARDVLRQDLDVLGSDLDVLGRDPCRLARLGDLAYGYERWNSNYEGLWLVWGSASQIPHGARNDRRGKPHSMSFRKLF